MLHRSERRTLTTKQVRETEAEAVAFVVCQSIGHETGTASADYIQLWNGDAKLLAESLEVVQRTAAVILGAISSRPATARKRKQPTSPRQRTCLYRLSRPQRLRRYPAFPSKHNHCVRTTRAFGENPGGSERERLLTFFIPAHPPAADSLRRKHLNSRRGRSLLVGNPETDP